MPKSRDLATIAVAASVRALRVRRGWRLVDLADELRGVDHPLPVSALSDLENGKRGVSVGDLLALAQVFAVEPGWLAMTPNERGRAEIRAVAVEVDRLRAAARAAAAAVLDHLGVEVDGDALDREVDRAILVGAGLSVTVVAKTEEAEGEHRG